MSPSQRSDDDARKAISERMRKVRSQDTTPEIAFRKALWSRGLRFRVCPKGLIGKPDVVMKTRRLAIFLDGEFWHGAQWRRRKLRSLADQFTQAENKTYWLEKIRRNVVRDLRVTATLLADGWTVLRFWESAIVKNLDDCVERTMEALAGGANDGGGSRLPPRTALEFFAGVGLMRHGLERAGWTIAFANDVDPKKRQMYEHQFGGEDFVLGDVWELDADRLPAATLATASFPCNDLSHAGAREGLEGSQSGAFWGFVQALDRMGERRPPMVLLENVVGFLTSRAGDDFHRALSALNRLGYAVDAFQLDAVHFTPQSRPRLFVVGLDARLADPPGPRFGLESVLRPRKLADFMLVSDEIEWSVRALPDPPTPQSRLAEIVEDLPLAGKEWWSRERAEYLFGQMSPKHHRQALEMIHGPRWSFGCVFRRVRNRRTMAELRVDGLAGCLRTPRGGSGRQILFQAGGGEYHVRLLTPRECARLMGADDFRIDVPTNQALFGFGDAVCSPVIQWIAENYLDPWIVERIRGRALAAPAAPPTA